MSLPRTQTLTVNGKRPVTAPVVRNQPDITPAQHDLIEFIYDSWNKVSQELEQTSNECSKGNPSVLYYVSQDSNPLLKDFRPFDLDAWFGKRLLQNLKQNSTPSSTSS